jgi:hypothetical protein
MHSISEYYKKQYSQTSSFEKMFGCEYINYYTKDIKHWNSIFREALHRFLFKQGVIRHETKLENLHNEIDKKYFTFDTVGIQNNSRPKISDLGFKFMISEKNLYYSFLKWIRENVIKKDFYFQKTPTIRFHIPRIEKRLSLPAWHSDSFLGHSPKEINFWFGLTDNKHSDFWINSLADSKEWFQEYSYDREMWKDICFSDNQKFKQKGFSKASEIPDIYNNLAIFDSRCIHAVNYRSERDLTTKITMDVRIILVDDYEWLMIKNKPVFVGGGIKKAEFRPGSKYGYHEKTVEEL